MASLLKQTISVWLQWYQLSPRTEVSGVWTLSAPTGDLLDKLTCADTMIEHMLTGEKSSSVQLRGVVEARSPTMHLRDEAFCTQMTSGRTI
jgi:hypothetical protein